jgi:cytochrome c-type biogenesis protein CcmH
VSTGPTTSPLAKGSPLRTWLPWAALLVVVVGLLAFGARTTAQTDQERALSVARTIACPTCDGESSAESNAPAAQEVRREIARRIAAGESDDQIRAYFAGQQGEQILLTPPSSGLGALVWILPIVALALAVGGLVVAFRRWQKEPHAEAVSDADRALVDVALRERGASPASTNVDDPRDLDDPHGEGGSR